MFADLGVMEAKVAEALKIFKPPTEIVAHDLDRVILFTGHRIDSAERKIPPFPASKEAEARDAIRKVVHEQKELTRGTMLGIAGGANGGDILLLEVCEEGIPTEMLLAIPED